jgi:hypothetical protein
VLTGRDAGAEIVCRLAQGPGAQAGDRGLLIQADPTGQLTRLVDRRGGLPATAPGATGCRGQRIGLSLVAVPPHSRRTMRNPPTPAKGRPQA